MRARPLGMAGGKEKLEEARFGSMKQLGLVEMGDLTHIGMPRGLARELLAELAEVQWRPVPTVKDSADCQQGDAHSNMSWPFSG